MKKFIIIAGPQAAGKTTVIASLVEQYQNACSFLSSEYRKKTPFLFPLQESRAIISHRDIVLGGIFMTLDQEVDVIRCDLRRMDLALHQPYDNIVYLDECNVFTIAHARAHGLTGFDEYWSEYIQRLEKLQAGIILLDADTSVSWERRHHRYVQRLACFPESEQQEILEKYRNYMEKLRPLLLEIYDRLPFPKEKIDGNLSKKSVAQEMSKALNRLADFSF